MWVGRTKPTSWLHQGNLFLCDIILAWKWDVLSAFVDIPRPFVTSESDKLHWPMPMRHQSRELHTHQNHVCPLHPIIREAIKFGLMKNAVSNIANQLRLISG